MDELDAGRTLILWFWALGLAGIEIEIEGGYGWAERMPTWFRKRGAVGRVYGVVMGGRPLTGYHVYAFTIPLLLLHLPFVSGVDWSLGAEVATVATYFALAVVWDYLWFVLNPAYTVKRFQRAASGGSRCPGCGASRATTTSRSCSRSRLRRWPRWWRTQANT